MPAPLSLSKAKITNGDVVWDRVSVIVRGGKATVRRGREVLVQDVPVLSVEATSRTTWRVGFAEGEWLVEKLKSGCGCS